MDYKLLLIVLKIANILPAKVIPPKGNKFKKRKCTKGKAPAPLDVNSCPVTPAPLDVNSCPVTPASATPVMPSSSFTFIKPPKTVSYFGYV